MRLGAYWQFIAPTPPAHPTDPADPAYDWSWLDPAVRDAAAQHIKILIQIGYPPTWALGRGAPPGEHSWRPNVTAVGQFARAVAKRYSGRFPDPQRPGHFLPRVTYYQAWNEPNISIQVSPVWRKTSNGRLMPESPYIYRRLLNAIYFNVKTIQPKAKVLLAGLDPYGDPPGGIRMHPVIFLREVLCLRGDRLRREYCPNPAHFDAIDHHPYASTPTHRAFDRYDVAIPDMWRLRHIVAVAVHKRLVRPIGPKPLWVTEISWNSKPPASYGLPLLRQARLLSAAFFAFWQQHITHMFWFLIADSDVPGALGDGLFFSSAHPKPAATAFRFPFVAKRGRKGIVTIWGHAPLAGTVSIQNGTGHGWRTKLRLRTTRGGIFYARRALAPHLVLRARIKTFASISWPGA